jgi:hypothetical protein
VAKTSKRPAKKSPVEQIWSDSNQWTVGYGRLVPAPGRPRKTTHLFRVLGEKLPIEALDDVRDDVRACELGEEGVYIAHDSMGYARYVGRGQIFSRIKQQAKSSVLEIKYFHFM